MHAVEEEEVLCRPLPRPADVDLPSRRPKDVIPSHLHSRCGASVASEVCIVDRL
jgi:hypothetical protein